MSTERRPGAARPEVLRTLLATTSRVVQEVDSVEYGLTDIQEYYANTGALKKAAENAAAAQGGAPRECAVSVVEAARAATTIPNSSELLEFFEKISDSDRRSLPPVTRTKCGP